MQYSEKTLQYYNNLQNAGDVSDSRPDVGTGVVGSPLCGDVMKLQLVFDANDTIIDAKYKVFGCVSAIASMELVTTMLKGRTRDEALRLSNNEVANTLELTKIKRHCSVLAKEAIEAAVGNYLGKKNGKGDLITATTTALEKLRALIAEQGCIGVFLTVADGSCSGLEYSLEYQTEADDSRALFEIEGVSIFYDPACALLIQGTVIDVVENAFGHGFVITNKNHVGCKNCTCKCKSE